MSNVVHIVDKYFINTKEFPTRMFKLDGKDIGMSIYSQFFHDWFTPTQRLSINEKIDKVLKETL